MGLFSFLPRLRLDPTDIGLTLPAKLEDPQALDRWAAQLKNTRLDWGRLAPLFCFRPDRYGRRVLFRSRRWEMVLACWLPGQTSPIHTHGKSMGAARVLLGAVRETRFAKEARGMRCLSGHNLQEGDVMLERQGDIHRVDNPSGLPAVTLHIYSPPLQKLEAIREAAMWTSASRPTAPEPLQLASVRTVIPPR